MKIYYDSPQRFTARIVKSWNKSGARYNAGNVQILRFAWIAKRYWANHNGEKVAKANIEDTNQKRLF